MEIIAYVVLAWFAGMFVADAGRPPVRETNEMIYQYRKLDGRKVIVNYKAYGHSTCRPQCYMSGSFYNAVVRKSVPWPFRKTPYYECPKENELDYCTGEVYRNGSWVALKDNIETPYFGELK